jgi:four helix bundle protein
LKTLIVDCRLKTSVVVSGGNSKKPTPENAALVRSAEEFKERTKQFALRIIRLVDTLPATASASHIGGQLLRAGTSVGSNYRAACRARSPAEFCAKLGIVEEEADETIYWIELLIEASLVQGQLLGDLIQVANEILAMVIASISTARRRKA